MPQRRDFLKGLGGATLALAGDALMPRVARAFGGEHDALAAPPLEVLPGKRPLIRRTYRPPNFETPIHYFNEVFTPNDAFFSAIISRTSRVSTVSCGGCVSRAMPSRTSRSLV